MNYYEYNNSLFAPKYQRMDSSWQIFKSRMSKHNSRVVIGSEHPRLQDWKGQIDLGTYFAAGVLG
ncbi:MAG: hypothetical protein EXR62_08105 [Chloroflexi bacterium]|nr:hypothetical protein [Chloroflexota bacterium]